jgi:hypothetical protein
MRTRLTQLYVFPLSCQFYQSIWVQRLMSMNSNGVDADQFFSRFGLQNSWIRFEQDIWCFPLAIESPAVYSYPEHFLVFVHVNAASGRTDNTAPKHGLLRMNVVKGEGISALPSLWNKYAYCREFLECFRRESGSFAEFFVGVASGTPRQQGKLWEPGGQRSLEKAFYAHNGIFFTKFDD